MKKEVAIEINSFDASYGEISNIVGTINNVSRPKNEPLKRNTGFNGVALGGNSIDGTSLGDRGTLFSQELGYNGLMFGINETVTVYMTSTHDYITNFSIEFDKKANQFAKTITINNNTYTNVNNYFTATFEKTEVLTVVLSDWNRPDYNACITYIYEASFTQRYTREWINSVNSLSQSTAVPSGLSTGTIASRGKAELIDNDGTISDMIEARLMTNAEKTVSIFLNGNQIQKHTLKDLPDRFFKNTVDFNLSNSFDDFDKKTYYRKYIDADKDGAIKSNLRNELFRVLEHQYAPQEVVYINNLQQQRPISILVSEKDRYYPKINTEDLYCYFASTTGTENYSEYNSISRYSAGSIVAYNGIYYICTARSLGNNPTKTAFWDIYRTGMGYYYKYDSSYNRVDYSNYSTRKIYQKGDTCIYNGKMYICKNNMTETANFSTTNWGLFWDTAIENINDNLYVSRGDTGYETTFKNYLEKTEVPIPHIPENTVRSILNKILQVAQLNLYLGEDGLFKLSSARPHATQAEKDNAIVILASSQVDDFNQKFETQSTITGIDFSLYNVDENYGAYGESKRISLYEESIHYEYVEATKEVVEIPIITEVAFDADVNDEYEKEIEEVGGGTGGDADMTVPYIYKSDVVETSGYDYFIINMAVKFNNSNVLLSNSKYHKYYQIKNDLTTIGKLLYPDYQLRVQKSVIDTQIGKTPSVGNTSITEADYMNVYLTYWIELRSVSTANIPAISTKAIEVNQFGNYYTTTNEVKKYGDLGGETISFSTNEFLQGRAEIEINNVKTNLADNLANNILSDYKNGVVTAKTRVFGMDYYDVNGNKVIDYTTKSEVLQVGQVVRIDKDDNGNSASVYPNGQPRYFRITGREFDFVGSTKIRLELQEVK